MANSILGRLIENAAVYNLGQRVAGVGFVDRQVREMINRAGLDHSRVVLDMGGGTGLSRKFWAMDCRYICLDTDFVKLRRFQRDHPKDLAVLSDASQASIGTRAADAVICKAVSHHLPDLAVDNLFSECARVLTPGGHLVFLEALWSPRRSGRFLWKIDRGSHPRTSDTLVDRLQRDFDIVETRKFVVLHEYLLCLAVRKETRSGIQ